MKITYIPSHSSIDIFFPLASATRLSAEWRIGVFQTLLQLGHKLEVCGSIDTTQRKVLQAIKAGDYQTAKFILPNAEDYAFYQNVTINETGYPSSPDILFIEGGTTNSFHTRKKGNEVLPVQQYVYEAISRHKGKVVWFCPEPKYAFRFTDLRLPTGNAKPETDLRALMTSSSKFLEGKKWIWVMTDHNKEEFLKKTTIPKDFPLDQIAFCPYGVAEPEICAPVMPIRNIHDLEWDIVYIGHTANPEEKKRKEQLVQLLSGAEKLGIRAAIIGNHDDDFNIEGVQKFPRTKNMGEARGILNKTLLTPLVLRHDFIATQHESNRQTQAVQCGCIPVRHPSVQYSEYLPSVSSIHDIAELVRAFRSSELDREAMLQHLRTDVMPKYSQYIPDILNMEGASIEDVWHKELPPPAPVFSSPTLL